MHQAELSHIKDNETSDRAAWERELREQIETEWRGKEAALEAKFKAEKDSEIDRVVTRLEAEATRDRKLKETEMDEKIK